MVRLVDASGFWRCLWDWETDDREAYAFNNQVVVFPPMLYDECPPPFQHPQVPGLDRERPEPHDDRSGWGGVVFLNGELGMGTGKAAEQAARALNEWAIHSGMTTVDEVLGNHVLNVDAEIFEWVCGPDADRRTPRVVSDEDGVATAVFECGFLAHQPRPEDYNLTGANAEMVRRMLDR